MYQTGLYTQREIGFINADGSNWAILEVGSYLRKPVWSYDGSLVYGLADGLPTTAYSITLQNLSRSRRFCS